MFGQQVYWKSVWGNTIRKCDRDDRYATHSKEEEKLYKQILMGGRKRSAK